MKLIDKDALVQYLTGMAGCACCDENVERIIRKFIIPHIDTIEVKEVDLEKEINTYISNNFFGSETLGFYANRTKEEPNDRDIALVAKYFFELGMAVSNKAQKGE